MTNFNEKSRTTYNEIAAHYDSTPDGRFTQKFKEMLLAHIELEEGNSVLDIGCGNGTLLAMLNKKKPIKGFGVDIAELMTKYAAIKNPGMEFKASGCENIPFDDKTMDIITVCAAYHHFPDIAAFTREAKRILKPGGKLYIAEIYLPTFLRVMANPFVPLLKAGDVKFYSPPEIIKNLSKAGFGKHKVKIIGRVQIVSMQKL
jgi:ubiquinone/menaquinone biosynthesis C-methylase UbiE